MIPKSVVETLELRIKALLKPDRFEASVEEYEQAYENAKEKLEDAREMKRQLDATIAELQDFLKANGAEE